MAKISLYPHHNYWWAPVWDCYPGLLLTLRTRNCQLSVFSTWLKFPSLPPANVKEHAFLRVVFLVPSRAPYFQRRWSRRESKQHTMFPPAGTVSINNTWFWCLFPPSDTFNSMTERSLNQCLLPSVFDNTFRPASYRVNRRLLVQVALLALLVDQMISIKDGIKREEIYVHM